MFTKIETENPETQPTMNQCIVFKTGGVNFGGLYVGESKAKPFSISGDTENLPTFMIEEWMPIRLWT